MDLDTTPGIDISLNSDVPMEDDTPSGCDLSLASDMPMDDDSPSGCNLSLASDVPMDEDTPSGCDLSLSSDVPMDEDTFPRGDTSLPSHTTASQSGPLHIQTVGAPGVTLTSNSGLCHKVLLKGSRHHLDCSQGAVGTNRDDRSSIPLPMDHSGTSGTSPQPKNTSLCPPKKMLPTDCSVPKPSKAILSTGHCNAGGTEPWDPQQGAGTDLPPSQRSVSPRGSTLTPERRVTKRKSDS
ncbi:hypothetical protein BTVI_142519 [Pitangus sulphuratus]|nr:hypothetical protein BTVI_142519 [Pitangus sulphuratus]